MPDTTVIPLESCDVTAGLMETALISSVMHLFKYGSLAPTPTTPLADYTAAECDFDGYAAITVTSTGPPFLLGAAWALETQQRFNFDSGSPLSGGNQVGGWYWVSATGKLIEYGTFDGGRPAQADGQAVFVTAVLPYQSGQVA
jgi:hypothetical protein